MSNNLELQRRSGFNTIDPPIFGSSEGCSGIYECKRKQYEDWLNDKKDKKYPIFLSDIGAQSSEFGVSDKGGGFAEKWSNIRI